MACSGVAWIDEVQAALTDNPLQLDVNQIGRLLRGCTAEPGCVRDSDVRTVFDHLWSHSTGTVDFVSFLKWAFPSDKKPCDDHVKEELLWSILSCVENAECNAATTDDGTTWTFSSNDNGLWMPSLSFQWGIDSSGEVGMDAVVLESMPPSILVDEVISELVRVCSLQRYFLDISSAECSPLKAGDAQDSAELPELFVATFDMMDFDGAGKLEAEPFCAAMRSIYPQLSADQARALCSSLPASGADLQTFCSVAIALEQGEARAAEVAGLSLEKYNSLRAGVTRNVGDIRDKMKGSLMGALEDGSLQKCLADESTPTQDADAFAARSNEEIRNTTRELLVEGPQGGSLERALRETGLEDGSLPEAQKKLDGAQKTLPVSSPISEPAQGSSDQPESHTSLFTLAEAQKMAPQPVWLHADGVDKNIQWTPGTMPSVFQSGHGCSWTQVSSRAGLSEQPASAIESRGLGDASVDVRIGKDNPGSGGTLSGLVQPSSEGTISRPSAYCNAGPNPPTIKQRPGVPADAMCEKRVIGDEQGQAMRLASREALEPCPEPSPQRPSPRESMIPLEQEQERGSKAGSPPMRSCASQTTGYLGMSQKECQEAPSRECEQDKQSSHTRTCASQTAEPEYVGHSSASTPSHGEPRLEHVAKKQSGKSRADVPNGACHAAAIGSSCVSADTPQQNGKVRAHAPRGQGGQPHGAAVGSSCVSPDRTGFAGPIASAQTVPRGAGRRPHSTGGGVSPDRRPPSAAGSSCLGFGGRRPGGGDSVAGGESVASYEQWEWPERAGLIYFHNPCEELSAKAVLSPEYKTSRQSSRDPSKPQANPAQYRRPRTGYSLGAHHSRQEARAAHDVFQDDSVDVQSILEPGRTTDNGRSHSKVSNDGGVQDASSSGSRSVVRTQDSLPSPPVVRDASSSSTFRQPVSLSGPGAVGLSGLQRPRIRHLQPLRHRTAEVEPWSPLRGSASTAIISPRPTTRDNLNIRRPPKQPTSPRRPLKFPMVREKAMESCSALVPEQDPGSPLFLSEVSSQGLPDPPTVGNAFSEKV